MIKEQYNLTDVHIGLFSPTNFLSGGSWKGFRRVFSNNFAFSNAVQFRASHFADVADNWGISFSIWNSGETVDKNNFNYTLIDNIDGEIKEVGEKVVYNIDNGANIKDWLKPSENLPQINAVPLKSGLNKGEDKGLTMMEGYIGGFINKSNCVEKNTQFVALFSSVFNDKPTPTISIMPSNFDKCTALFSARRLVACDWVNWADEYLVPNEGHEKYQEFVNDSIVYSLFESKSNQSSLRQVDYKDKKWDIKNEFFFMPKNDIMSLASENGYDFTFNDANVSNERYVYTKLQGIELSEEAKSVLDMAIDLVKASFKYRGMFDEEHPEYQIMNWDCGWYQIKGMLKEYMPNALKEFNELFKALGDKMRPMVYELGFLK
jgi:hypothetical protein